MKPVFLLFSLWLLFLGCGDGKVAPCTDNSQCAAEEMCVEGVCRVQDSTACNPACSAEQVCMDGSCRAQWPVTCSTSSQCAKDEVCLEGVCQRTDPTACNPACNERQVCIDGICRENPDPPPPPVDSESFDPTHPGIDWTQATETTRNACHPDNLRQISFEREAAAQIALGLPLGFGGNYEPLQRGGTRGLMGVDLNRNVAFVAWRHSENVTSLAALTELMEKHAGGLSAREWIYASFTSWDAPSNAANALRVTFQLSGNMSPAVRANNMATTLLGNGPGLPDVGTAGATQYVRAQYVLRGNEAIVVMAVALNTHSVSLHDGLFGLADVAGGAALARYYDRPRARCEPSRTQRRAVDFLFVVDDSASMGTSQTRLAAASTAMANALENSTLDWRAALVTSSYHLTGAAASNNRGIVRGFTEDVQVLQSWLRQGSTCQTNNTCSPGTGFPAWSAPAPTCVRTGGGYGANGGCWVGTGGSGSEGMLGAARLALMNLRGDIRADADIVVVILTDTEDQTTGLYSSSATQSRWEPIAHFVDFFQGKPTQARQVTSGSNFNLVAVPPIRAGLTIPVHAIYCPAGQNCGDSAVPAAVPTRIQRVVQETGGFLSSIRNESAIPNTMAEIVDDIIGRAGVETKKPFVGASMRVAIQHTRGECNGADVPRSRLHGFDYDGFAQTVSFFGNCRPPRTQESNIAISYRTWDAIERIPCEDDPNFDEALGACKNHFICVDEVCVCPTETEFMCGSGMCEESEVCDTPECRCIGDFS